jgi:acyl-CoA synthetase (AMP-forming)/AMP-acid ligase II
VGLTRVRDLPSDRRRKGNPTFDSVSVIQFSSGSTGTAKLILVTHSNLLDVARKLRNWFGLSHSDRCVCMLPIHSGFGFTSNDDASEFSGWIEILRPTWFVATPTFLHAVLDRLHASDGGKMQHAIRFIASTTSYLPEAVREGLERALGRCQSGAPGAAESGHCRQNFQAFRGYSRPRRRDLRRRRDRRYCRARHGRVAWQYRRPERRLAHKFECCARARCVALDW